MAIFNQYNFKFNGVSIPNWEPVGWDSVKLTLRRQKDDNGYEFTFSDSLELDGKAAAIVRAAYQERFIDAYVKVEIDSCFGWHYEGVINFTLYKERNNRITVGIKESTFSDTFSNRYETPVDFSKLESIDGVELTILEFKEILLHSKELVLEANYNVFEGVNKYEKSQNSNNADPPSKFIFTPPLLIKNSDFSESASAAGFDPNQSFFYSGFRYPIGITTRTIHLTYTLDFLARYTVHEICQFSEERLHYGTFRVYLKILSVTDDGASVNTDTLLNLVPEQTYPGVGPGEPDVSGLPVVVSGDLTFDIPQDCVWTIEVHFDGAQLENLNCLSAYFLEAVFNTNTSTMQYVENSIYPDSTAKTYLIYEALNRAVASITGVPDAIRSDFYGRTDSAPFAYPVDGPGSLIAVTNGFQIRKFEDRPVVSSFKTLFESLNAIDNLGLRVEGDKIRIEPKQYFYKLEAKKQYPFVSDLQEAISLIDVYNEIEIEYQNQGDTKQINKLDEFNTKRNYSTPIRQHKNKLQIRCEAITSGYAIEFTRREQYKSSPSTDYPTDNNIFFIALVRAGFSFAPEKDTPFLPVTKVISPSTVYNIRFSPGRILRRWQKVFAGCLFRSFDKKVKFISGTGNYLMEAGGITENADLMADTANALFNPIEATFEVPMTFQEFLYLRENSIYTIQYSCSNANFKTGFIRQIEFEPGSGGGMATIKLIQANADRNENLPDA